jgi:hypothetical protein
MFFLEKTTTTLSNKLENLYQAKFLVNKNFMQKKLFALRMGDGDFIFNHMNAIKTIVTQSISIGVKMDEEDHCMTLLCSFLDLWDNLVMAIQSDMMHYCQRR